MSPIIDARGKACPTPVIMAKKAISAGESGGGKPEAPGGQPGL